jgi:hypothetical protein
MAAIDFLRIVNFKGFRRFDIRFTADNWLVGPNNAGKSTVIAALRTGAAMIRQAKRLRTNSFGDDGGFQPSAHTFASEQFGFVDENLRHEFRDVETRLEFKFGSGSTLIAIWPSPSDELEPFFYVRSEDGVVIRDPARARRSLPDVGVIPILSPVEHREERLTEDHVRSNLASRLASRHARNQLLLLRYEDAETEGFDDRLAEFLEWAEIWTPDFRICELNEQITDEGVVLDVFCRERDARSDRELFWAGDGVQVWTQLLMHLFRNRDRSALILDEPDLFLHADLQRRLVRLLEEMSAQTIAASHSAEVLAEAPPKSVVWISRDRPRAVRAPTERVASDLSSAIGSQFNLRLARALRAQAVLFVEGDDMRVLRNVAKTLGAKRVAAELGVISIPLGGFSNWENVEPFAWMLDELLDRSVQTLVVLDRDYRTDGQVVGVEGRLRALGVEAHVWRKKELESYLLVPSAIARRARAPIEQVTTKLIGLASAKRNEVSARMLSEALSTEVTAHRHRTIVTETALAHFDRRWGDEDMRPAMCNAKDIVAGMNAWLQQDGYRTVSARSLSSALHPDEIADEMVAVIEQAEDMLA